MTSEYLKQLQLTKQLEQKAKETTKNRKLAEDRLGEAEASIAGAREMRVDVKLAEAALKEGQQAFAKREYLPAIAAADRALKTALELQCAMVENVLISAQGIVAMIDDTGQDHKAIEELVDRARDLLKECRYEEALATARQSEEAATAYGDRRMEGMFAQLAHLIEVAEREKLAVASRKQALAKAVKLHEEGDREGSLSRALTLFKGIQEAFVKLVEGRAGSILELAEGAAPGGDVTAVTERVHQAREAVARGRIEESLDLLEEAQKAVLPLLAKAVEVLIAAQRDRARWLSEQGVNVARFEIASKKVSEAYGAGESEEALELLRRSEKSLRDAEVEVVLGRIELLRPRMALAAKLKADLGGVSSRLEEARMATVYGRGQEALERVEEASLELDDALAPFRRVAAELDTTRKVFLQARRMRIVSSEATRLVAKAREDALAGRMGDSCETLAKAKKVLVRKVQERCARQILNGQLMLTAGLAVGAEVEDEEEDLEDLMDDLRDGTLDGISARLASINLELESALMTGTVAAIRKAELAIADAPMGMDTTTAVDLKRRSREALERKDWCASHALAEEAVSLVEEARRSSQESRCTEARHLLDLCRQLGIESQTLVMSLDRAEGDHDRARSVRSVEEVIHYANALVRDDLSRSLSQITRGSSAARKNGVNTNGVDRLIDEANRALAADDVSRAFIAYSSARRELEKTTALHHEVYDLIVLLSRLSGELSLPPDSKVIQLLGETKAMFEAGLYDGARTSARKCYKEAETVGAALLAPQALREAQEVVPALKQVGADPEGPEKVLAEAALMLGKGEHLAALNAAREERRKMVEVINETVHALIAKVREDLDREGARSSDGPIRDIADKADDLLVDQRFSDAVRAARFARLEADQFIAARAAAAKEIAVAEDGIQEIEALGVSVLEPREVLEQARKHRGSGRCNLVAEMARRAHKGALAAAESSVRNELVNIEKEYRTIELSGKDLQAIGAFKNAALDDLSQGRFGPARRNLALYRQALSELVDDRQRCSALVAALTEQATTLPPSTLRSEAEPLLSRARQSMAKGSFRECLVLCGECQVVSSSMTSYHQALARELGSLKERVESSHAPLSPTGEASQLLLKADDELRQGRYGDAYCCLLKADRLGEEERDRAARQGIAGLVNALRLAGPAELTADKFPASVRGLLDKRMSSLRGLRNMSELNAAARAAVHKGLDDRRMNLLAKASGDHETDTRSLLQHAALSLDEDRLEAAVEDLKEVERSLGSPVKDRQEFRELRHRYMDLAMMASQLGLEGVGVDEYRRALAAPSLHEAKKLMATAVRKVEAGVSEYLPELTLQTTRVTNVGHAPALDLSLEGVRFAPVIWPQTSSKLPPQGIGRGKVRVSYRVMFVPHPVVKELAQEGGR